MGFAEQRDDLLQSIQHDQEVVHGAIQELAEAAHETLSLSEHIRRYPLAWVIGGFVVGVWLGAAGSDRT